MNSNLIETGSEIRNPNSLLIVDKVFLEKYPEKREKLGKYYDVRADRGMDSTFLDQVKQYGSIHSPVHIVRDEELQADVVIAGRQRVKAARVLGFQKIPVLIEELDEIKNTELEITENLARSQNSIRETHNAIIKSLNLGKSRAAIATLIGITEAGIQQLMLVGEMPDFIHEMIKRGTLSETVALQLAKTFGKKAAKGSGRLRTYDKDTVSNMKTSIAEMGEAAKQAGKKGITVRQAKDSKTRPEDVFSKKEWELLLESNSTPSDMKLLISVFVGKLTYKQARSMNENLNWLVKIVPAKKEKPVKKVKEAKVKVTDKVDIEDVDVDALFEE